MEGVEKKEKKKKVCSRSLISSKHFTVSDPFLPQRKCKNSSMLKSGAVIQNLMFLCVCGGVCLCVALQAGTRPRFLHPVFALVKAKPQRTRPTDDPLPRTHRLQS